MQGSKVVGEVALEFMVEIGFGANECGEVLVFEPETTQPYQRV
jgi:hypothetical protein